MTKKHLFLFVLTIISLSALNAQQTFDFDIFNGDGELRGIYNQKHKINNTYTLNLDGGAYIGLGNNIWTRWGFRGNIQRTISHKYSYDIGFMYNHVTYPDFSRQEFRPHQAFHVNYPRFKSSVLKHRFRLEERIFTHVHDDVRDFKIRLRYRILHQGRFNGQAITPKTFYYRAFAEFNFNVYNEVENKFLVRGRYCAGYGYQFNSKLSMDANYYFEHTKVARGYDAIITNIFQLTIRQTIHWQNNKAT